jgi:hypothetical protein
MELSICNRRGWVNLLHLSTSGTQDHCPVVADSNDELELGIRCSHALLGRDDKCQNIRLTLKYPHKLEQCLDIQFADDHLVDEMIDDLSNADNMAKTTTEYH